MAANFREGDWSCPSCGNHNFASRGACNKCQAPKAGGGYGAAPGAAKGFGQAMGGKGAARFNPYTAATPQRTPNLPATARPGDWVCPMCQNHNYANRSACNRCQTPKMGMGGMGGSFGMMGGMGFGMQPNLRQGDWVCKVCNNHNYASRENCNKCHISKDTFISKSGMREGDWICASCNNHNYASKTVCNKCGTPKGNTASHTAPGGASGGNRGMRDGDWMCPACNNHNFASREKCNKCGGVKPGGPW